MRLARLTAAKAVANTALRWVPPFLPTLDRGRERLVMTLALLVVSVSSLVALVGTTFTFAVGFLLVVLGVANLTVAGHSTISRRERETSWAIALLISLFGWRGSGSRAPATALPCRRRPS